MNKNKVTRIRRTAVRIRRPVGITTKATRKTTIERGRPLRQCWNY